MAFDINIPTAMGDKSLEPFFKGWKWFHDPYDPVILHLRRGVHVAPWVATLFGAYGVWLKEVRSKEVALNYDPETYAGRFLQKIGLPQILGSKANDVEIDESRIFPLTRVKKSKEIAAVATAVMNILQIGDEEIESAIKYSLIELLRNVVQHSRSRIGGFVSAAYFPRSGIVDVVVADIGCGLKSSLRTAYPEIDSDQKAVRFALQPHVSGTFESGAYHSMRDNAGLGLFFIKEIASRSNGGFFLGSGSMLADIWGTSEGNLKKRYIQSKSDGWRGTFALLQLRRDSIGEFGDLLAMCRQIAADVRKDRSELAVDFVDEKLDIEGLFSINVKDFEEDVEVAAEIRDKKILPFLIAGELIVLDFSGVRAATQSFVHALMYKLFRDGRNLETCLSVSCADGATEEAIRAVSAYASVAEG